MTAGDWIDPDDAIPETEVNLSRVNGHAVAIDPVQFHWARWKDGFAEAMDDGFWTIEDLEEKVLSHRAFLFPGDNCCAVGEIQLYPGGVRAMQIMWATGDLHELISLEPGVVALCRTLGCNRVVIQGRAGWSRALRGLGYDPFSVTVCKVI